MKSIFAIITFLFMSGYVYSQTAEYVKGKDYEGYVFPKEHAICGFPPEQNRYTPSEEDIAQAEKILKDSIGTDYVKSNQEMYKKPPINKRTLKKYVRQYVGYLTENNEIIIWINFLHRDEYDDEDKPKDADRIDNEIITIFDGGYYFWRICINLSTQKLSDMSVNGIS
jgi:hypothetical protein